MIKAEMKYVVFTGHNGEQIITFPKIIQHSVMADDVSRSSFGGLRPISGGFIYNGECVGESESLRMSSRPEDTELLKKLVGILPVTTDNTVLLNLDFNDLEQRALLHVAKSHDTSSFNKDVSELLSHPEWYKEKYKSNNPSLKSKNQAKRLRKKLRK